MRSFWTIFRFSSWRLRWTILGWGIPLMLLGLITTPFYDLVAENERQLRPVIQGLKPLVKSFIGGEQAEEIFTPQGFLALRYFAFLPVILGIFASVAGSGMLATDEERGILDFLLAHPAGRASVFFGRMAATICSLVAILLLAWVGLWLGVLRAGSLHFPPGQILLPYISVLAVSTFFLALSLALSMMMPSRVTAAMTTGFIVLAGEILTNLAKAISQLQPAAQFSPLTYFQANAMRGLHIQPVLGLLAIALFLTGLAWLGFQRRDIRVAGDGGWKLPFLGRRKGGN
ncbi:MAG: ABC transporter permease subunit [Verrucomicrobiales bacterium]|nr:ABC transporter permease subunit [Verrucomicrobiales bacterium]MED5586756.1 ABC transporter permease subunit [Verrucomicrobiota bacterium]